VAIFNIEAKLVALRPKVLLALSDYLATQLAASGAYRLIPRDQLKRRLSTEKRASYKACYEQSCQIEIGRELAAQKCLAAKIIKLGKVCTVSLELYDLRSATTERVASRKGGCREEDLTASIDAAVLQLVGGRKEPLSPTRIEPARVSPAHAEPTRPTQPGVRVAPISDLRGASLLSRTVILEAVRTLRGPVQGCFSRHREPGTYQVELTIGPDGDVRAARLRSGQTNATGRCVLEVARGARFPRFYGSPVTFSYPFVLK
jgi:hypothetical protein